MGAYPSKCERCDHLAELREAERAIIPVPFLSSFESFPELPIELRNKIWKIASDDLPPRIVTINYEKPCCQHHAERSIVSKIKNPECIADGSSVTFQEGSSQCVTDCSTPAILHTSREARKEGQRSYRLSFGTPTDGPRIHFDFQKDTLFCTTLLLNSCRKPPMENQPPQVLRIRQRVNQSRNIVETEFDFKSHMRAEEMKMVERFAFRADRFIDIGYHRLGFWVRFQDCYRELCAQFPNLEELIFVTSPLTSNTVDQGRLEFKDQSKQDIDEDFNTIPKAVLQDNTKMRLVRALRTKDLQEDKARADRMSKIGKRHETHLWCIAEAQKKDMAGRSCR